MSCDRDNYNGLKVTNVLSPAANNNLGTTPVVTAIVDTLGYDSLTFAILTGSLSDTNATYAVLVEDGDTYSAPSTLSDAAAVDDKWLLGTEAGAAFAFGDDNETRKIGYIGKKRYVRLTITPTGADSGDSFLAVLAIQGHARHDPQSSQG